jgi:hypothetical protein
MRREDLIRAFTDTMASQTLPNEALAPRGSNIPVSARRQVCS